MNELHLFAGAGGGILGGMLLGPRKIDAEPYCVAAARIQQADASNGWCVIASQDEATNST